MFDAAKGGPQKDDTPVTRRVKEIAQATGQRPCDILKAMKKKVKNSSEKEGIVQAQKYFGCRNEQKRRKGRR